MSCSKDRRQQGRQGLPYREQARAQGPRTLLKHKVVKKGPKHPETKYFHYQVSTIGKKYLESGAVPKS